MWNKIKSLTYYCFYMRSTHCDAYCYKNSLLINIYSVSNARHTKQSNQTELNCAVASLGVPGFATSLQQS